MEGKCCLQRVASLSLSLSQQGLAERLSAWLKLTCICYSAKLSQSASPRVEDACAPYLDKDIKKDVTVGSFRMRAHISLYSLLAPTAAEAELPSG